MRKSLIKYNESRKFSLLAFVSEKSVVNRAKKPSILVMILISSHASLFNDDLILIIESWCFLHVDSSSSYAASITLVSVVSHVYKQTEGFHGCKINELEPQEG